MGAIYYKIPLKLSSVLEGNDLPACNLSDSITKNLELIIMTNYGEHRCDPSFGCGIWELDFEIITSQNLWEEKLRLSLLESIKSHEGRLSNVVIVVTISELQKQNYLKQYPEIRKCVEISINAIIKKTGVEFNFNTNLFLSPLSKN
ncbi:MAG TPA: GPW/gp25 family protein [Mucilaginibacter sp.]|jgi:phage baseplate assembly protein W|nr:GPW/gp25 family protein [Mucilaginibacter sp.]